MTLFYYFSNIDFFFFDIVKWFMCFFFVAFPLAFWHMLESLDFDAFFKWLQQQFWSRPRLAWFIINLCFITILRVYVLIFTILFDWLHWILLKFFEKLKSIISGQEKDGQEKDGQEKDGQEKDGQEKDGQEKDVNN